MDPQVNIIHFLCRLCGSKTQELQRINMFDGAGVLLDVKAKIKFCLGMDINDKDNLPQVLCSDCVNNVDNFCKFKENAEKTTNLLKSLLNQEAESDENLQNSCNITEQSSPFNMANYTSEPEEIVVKPENPLLYHRKTHLHKKVSKNKKRESKKSKNKTQKRSNIKVTLKTKNKKIKTDKRPVKKEFGKKLTPGIYECDVCKKIFFERSRIICHIQYNHFVTVKNFECSHCMKTFRLKSQIRHHIANVHVREQKFVCDFCGSGFYNKGSFNYHIKSRHTQGQSVECSICNKRFAVMALLRNHVNNVHRKDKSQWVCDVCGKALANKYSLTKHKIRHEKTPEELQALKIYKCLVCDVSYDHPCNLRYHMRIHTGEKLFECKYCKKRYTCKTGLNIHILTHTGERQFVCDVCGKAFAVKKNLNIHKLIHTGERRFQCNDCDKTYTQNSTLNIHLKKTGHTRKRV